MSSGLNSYFKSYVDPHRSTVLVQGGHKSGKTTLLNALLGCHALPYFTGATTAAGDTAKTQHHQEAEELRRPVHGQTTSRYTAGPGSTAVCILNAASVNPGYGGEKGSSCITLTPPENGHIQHLIVPSSMTFTGFTRPGDAPVPPEIAGTTHLIPALSSPKMKEGGCLPSAVKQGQLSDDPSSAVHLSGGGGGGESPPATESSNSAFCFVEKVYPDDFDVVGEVVTMPHLDDDGGETASRNQAFYYDAVGVMEAHWRQWALALQQSGKEGGALPPPSQHQSGKGEGEHPNAPERMLFIVGVNQEFCSSGGGAITPLLAEDFGKVHPDLIPCGPQSMPPLHCVESTDLSDRPPMTFVHSSLVVLTDTQDAPHSGNDQDGARRMYIQSTLFTRANNQPCLVYNLLQTGLNKMAEKEVEDLRHTLSRTWNVGVANIYILNLRNALADVMLAKVSFSIPAMNPKDTAELNRLRTMVANHHVQAHSRFTERVLAARLKYQNVMEEEEMKKDKATTTTVEATPPAPPSAQSTPPALQQTNAAAQQVLSRQTSYEPKCIQQQQAPVAVAGSCYVPRVLRGDHQDTTSLSGSTYIPVSLRSREGGAVRQLLAKDEYVPKCVEKEKLLGPSASNVRHQIKAESRKGSTIVETDGGQGVVTPTATPVTETRPIIVAPLHSTPPNVGVVVVAEGGKTDESSHPPSHTNSSPTSSSSGDLCSSKDGNNSSFDYLDDSI